MFLEGNERIFKDNKFIMISFRQTESAPKN